MRTVMIAVLGFMLPCISAAEDVAQGVKFEFGTTLNAVLSDTLDARKNKPGDTVKARISEDVKSGGVVVIPRGAKLVGHVTEAQPAGKGEQARLGVEFDRAELKDGRQIPLHTAFYALAAPAGAASEHGLTGGGFGGGFGGGGSAVANMASTSGRSDSDDSDLGMSHPKQEDLKASPGAVGGLNRNGTLYASSRGVFGLEDISLEPNTVPSSGSAVILANARTVHLSTGTRMLLSVEAASNSKS
jgi:hypothetical protein